MKKPGVHSLLRSALAIALLAGCSKDPDGSAASTAPPSSKPAESPSAFETPAPTAGNGTSARPRFDKSIVSSARELALSDFKQCLEWVDKNIPDAERDAFLQALALNLSHDRPEVAIQAANAVSDSSERESSLIGIIGIWRKQNPEKLLELAKNNLSAQHRNRAFTEAIDMLASRGEFQKAAGALQEMPFSNNRSDVIGRTATLWADKDPEAAKKWIATLDVVEDRTYANGALAAAYLKKGDVDGLVDFINTVQERPVILSALPKVADLLAKRDGPEAALKWASALPPDLQARAKLGIIPQLAAKDVNQASEFAKNIPGKSEQAEAFEGILGSTFRANPEKAAAWSISPAVPNEQSKNLIFSLVTKWYNQDSIKVSEWINTLPKSPRKDYAIDALARQLVFSDRASAVQTANAISDPAMRASFFREYHLSPDGK